MRARYTKDRVLHLSSKVSGRGFGRRTRRLRASRLQHAGGRHAGRAQVLDVLRTWTDENEQAIKEEKDLAQTLLDDFSRWLSVEAKAAEASGQPTTAPDESRAAANAPSPEQQAAALAPPPTPLPPVLTGHVSSLLPY
jgi:hypothetical protein